MHHLVDLLCIVLTLTILLPAVRSQVDFDWNSITPSDDLVWKSCYTPPLQCARFNVPMNYSNPTAGSFALALIRIPSTLNETDAYRGPVLFNPGGPSQSGVDAVLQSGAELSTVIGPEFDIVSLDPRGVSRSTPAISFFLTDAERAAFDYGPHATNATATPDALPGQWAHFQVLGRLAQDRDTTGMLSHVTTDNVARDMLRIVRAHGEDRLKYWGISYGSVLGATFAAMFPDKVERLIIDGVFDMEGYYNTDWFNETLDTNKVREAFFSGCHKAGPEACQFYDTSPTTISRNLDKLYAQVIAQPVIAYSHTLSAYGVVDHPTLKNAIFNALFTPHSSFSVLAQRLADIQRGNGSVLYQLSQPQVDDVIAAISCANGKEVTDNGQALREYTQGIGNLSSFSSVIAGIRTLCSGWRIYPANFKGPIMENTSFPLLIIGNTADPVTPLAGAIKTSKSFPGSIVLTQDSLGHTSFTSPSNCTLAYVHQYFLNGTILAPEIVCPVTAPLFPIQTQVRSRRKTEKRTLEDVVDALGQSLGKFRISRRWI